MTKPRPRMTPELARALAAITIGDLRMLMDDKSLPDDVRAKAAAQLIRLGYGMTKPRRGG